MESDLWSNCSPLSVPTDPIKTTQRDNHDNGNSGKWFWMRQTRIAQGFGVQARSRSARRELFPNDAQFVFDEKSALLSCN